ncbi:uncharacterized protein LOC120993783, partial [Bufo bufo]|uniref:uncharacterized protein LOC120993783 n=1 Tax=Bufo bufo TaxID=8384 RepID=UPI001ABEABE1
KKNYQYSEKDQNSSSIIKFLNTTVSKFSKKGSSQIANHLELYESTMDSLKLYSDADRIRFLPWAFDDKYRHYFTSFRERGIQDWPSVLHEVKLEFGPYRTITAAKRDIYKLTCRPNQSPREFLSILKNAYGLAYRSPNWESEEFKQLFYDAMPTQIKLSLARDLDIEAPLDRLVTAATTLYNISECHETGERRFKKSPEQNIAEAKVNPSLGFETQPRKYPQSTGPVQQTQQQQVRPKQTKPQNPNGSEGDNSGAGRSNYRPYYNNGPQYRSYYNRDSQGYRRWNNRPRQQREDRQEPLNSPRSRSPTNNQGASQNQNMRKPNRRKMPTKIIAIIYVILILGKEFHAEPIVVPDRDPGDISRFFGSPSQPTETTVGSAATKMAETKRKANLPAHTPGVKARENKINVSPVSYAEADLCNPFLGIADMHLIPHLYLRRRNLGNVELSFDEDTWIQTDIIGSSWNSFPKIRTM